MQELSLWSGRRASACPRFGTLLVALMVGLGVDSAGANAQRMPTGRLIARATDVATPQASAVAGFQVAPKAAPPAPWWAPAASAVIPGSGQLLLKQQRSVAYAVAEAFLIVQAFGAQHDANRDRQRYRTIASDVARKPFSSTRPVGSWDYYESMEKKDASGAYDMIPGGALDPETDTSTHNGAAWLAARETYWTNPNIAPAVGSPEYARALNYYQQHAYTDQYLWSWRDAQLQKDVYIQTIAAANRSYQRVNSYVGLIGANHLASLIDAYISVRIRRYGGAGIAGIKVDGISTDVTAIGDPADGKRMLRTQLRLVPR